MKILLAFAVACLIPASLAEEGSIGKSPTVRIDNTHGTAQNPKGRVEVLHNDEWKGVCMIGWGYNEQNVVCKQLGYVKAIPLSSTASWTFNPTTEKPFLMGVECNGDEKSLAECSNPGEWKTTGCHPTKRKARAWCLGDVPVPSFNRIGCFRDKVDDRALGDMYANLRYLMDWKDYYTSAVNIQKKCAEGAFAMGYRYFGIQNWGECFGVAGDRPRYDKYGLSRLCKDGLGYDQQNDVYVIGRYRDAGCWKDKGKARTMNWLHSFRGGIDWYDMSKTVESCFQKLLKEKMEKDEEGSNKKYYFAIQFYGECWYGTDEDFKKHGESKTCWNGVGQGWTNNVYEVLY